VIIKSYEILKKTSNFSNYNLFLLYGENLGLKKDIKESIKKSLNEKNSNIEVLSFYESDINNNEEIFYNSIFSGSLFSDKKIITIYSVTDKLIKQLEDVADKFPQNIILIIFSDILEKKSKIRSFFEKNKKTLCIPCYLDSERDLQYIAMAEFKKHNIILSREATNLLIDKSNNDRNNLKNEIDKIISFSLNKKKLEIEEIKSIINFTGEYKSDELINECLCGNVIKYKKILSELYSSTINQIFLLRILNNKIQRLLNMKEVEKNYSSLDSLLSSTKPPIFWKEKPIVKLQMNIWKFDELKKIINEISETEILCKKNPQISKIVFLNFFTKICKMASNYS
jgi:DNA polymerase III subunit delta